jgi:hypothetical protein
MAERQQSFYTICIFAHPISLILVGVRSPSGKWSLFFKEPPGPSKAANQQPWMKNSDHTGPETCSEVAHICEGT